MRTRLFALVRSLLFGAGFVALWSWLVPGWIAAGKGVTLSVEPSAPAMALMTAGLIIMTRCVVDFAWAGLGTPAPFDPPRRFVVSGFYRWVRNPMYLGMGLFLAGEALLLPAIRREMFILVAVLGGAVSLFIYFYEEPHLRRTFGARYEQYCANVRRWIPRLRPYDLDESQI